MSFCFTFWNKYFEKYTHKDNCSKATVQVRLVIFSSQPCVGVCSDVNYRMQRNSTILNTVCTDWSRSLLCVAPGIFLLYPRFPQLSGKYRHVNGKSFGWESLLILTMPHQEKCFDHLLVLYSYSFIFRKVTLILGLKIGNTFLY